MSKYEELEKEIRKSCENQTLEELHRHIFVLELADTMDWDAYRIITKIINERIKEKIKDEDSNTRD